MSRVIKFVTAVVAVIAVFAMPAASMPLHCMLTAPSGESAHPCHMMGMNSSTQTDQMSSVAFDHSCCQVSAAKTESMSVFPSPSGKGTLAPPATSALLAKLPAEPALRDHLDFGAPPPGGLPQAVLCTFLI